MFTRNFMKTFPIRKYGNVTGKGTSTSIKAAASPAIFGFSTKRKYGSSDQSYIPCSLPLPLLLSITSTLVMRYSDISQDPLPIQYADNNEAL